MPYSATTAYGALHDHLAICGGYAQAFQMLLQQAEIPCITVSGKMGGENHMWVLAQVDGQWLYFDPTSDRGRVDYGFNRQVGEDLCSAIPGTGRGAQFNGRCFPNRKIGNGSGACTVYVSTSVFPSQRIIIQHVSAQMIGIALSGRKKRVAVSAWMMLSRARTAPPHQPG